MNTVELQLKEWLQQLADNPTFVWTDRALQEIPSVERDARLPTALMLFYLQRRIQVSTDWQARFVVLMRTMLEKGHVAEGVLNRKPVWLHLFQYRFFELYPLLKRPSIPSVAPSIQLAGFFGALVKSALKVQVNGESVKEVVSARQSHFDHRSVLHSLSTDRVQQVSIPELMRCINRIALPIVRDGDERTPYQVGVHPKLPKIVRYLIHDAVLNGHHTLLQSICNRNASSLSLKDNWSRTALHLMAIFDIDGDEFSTQITPEVSSIKDGFGRTAAEIRAWKQQRVQTSALSPSQSQGGWDNQCLSEYRTEKQDVDVVDFNTLSWAQFQEQYASCAKPVLIRGVPNVDVLQRKWQREAFESRYASLPVEVGDVPYARSLGRDGGIKTFAEYRASKRDYAFVQLHPKQHASLLSDIPRLGYFSNLIEVHTQFYQGVAGTGAPMHLHIDAWNCLVYGEKRWFLMPPFQGAYSSMPIQQWVDKLYPSMQVIECTQRAGDILYVPKYWSHAVLNLKESIGIAREFLNPYLS